jgi:hypothetical protein
MHHDFMHSVNKLVRACVMYVTRRASLFSDQPRASISIWIACAVLLTVVGPRKL